MVAPFLFAPLLLAANIDSPHPSLIPPEGRERLLREAQVSLKRENPAFEWHTPKAEKLLESLLARELRDKTAADALERIASKKSRNSEIDLDALWLLCRSCMGGIEAALLELGTAYTRVEHIRTQWRTMQPGALSIAANHAVAGGAKSVARGLKSVGYKLRSSSKSTKPTLVDLEKDGHASPADGPTVVLPENEPPEGGKMDAPTTSQPLGSDRTRLGLGIRRRALLRSEMALASHAGALHDLRVLLHNVGGEWLEVGRWVGGPPLGSLQPWDVVPCREQLEHLLNACSRIVTQMESTANALAEHGPFGLYAQPLPKGARGGDPPRLESSRPELIDATRSMLESLKRLRHAARHKPPPGELVPPNSLQRHSLVWVALLMALAYLWKEKRVLVLAMRSEAAERALKLIGDVKRFLYTHVNEPLRAIATELFQGYTPTIDPKQVAETRASLIRMLQEFVTDTHNAADGDEALQAALEKASTGSMEAVTAAYEQQVASPVRSIINGELLRSCLLLVQQLRLLMEEEVASIDTLLARNDFNLQVMATVPALALFVVVALALRSLWRRFRGADSARRDPIEAIQAQVIAIDAILTRAEGARKPHDTRPPPFQRCELSLYEASPMALNEVGELIFRVERLRTAGSHWLRGLVRNELMHDAQVLLDSGRLSATQRSRVAQTLLRRLDSLDLLRDHW